MSKTRGWLATCPQCERELGLYSKDKKKWECGFCKFTIYTDDDWIQSMMVQLSELRESIRGLESKIKLLVWAEKQKKGEVSE